MKALFIGDIVGSGGRDAVRALVPELRRELNVQFVIANAENCAGGNGLTAKCAAEMAGAVDVFTAGDHVWDQKGFESEITTLPNVLRPANFSAKQPGRGWGVFPNPAGGSVAVIVLMGKVFMRESSYCPFETVDKILHELPSSVKNIFVDFHAEATSEKIAMGYFLEGRVTAVIGTHTHVPTADVCVLPGGTAYCSDAGMVGAARSVLGREVDDVLYKFTTGMPGRLRVAEGPVKFGAVLVEFDYTTGRAISASPVYREYNPQGAAK